VRSNPQRVAWDWLVMGDIVISIDDLDAYYER